MRLLQFTSAVIVLAAGASRNVAAQVGVRIPSLSPRDSVAIWPQPSPMAKVALPGLDWPRTPPVARVADLQRERSGAILCPMPVFVPDASKPDHMPIGRVDTGSVEKMPVAKSACENPLWSGSRP